MCVDFFLLWEVEHWEAFVCVDEVGDAIVDDGGGGGVDEGFDCAELSS